MRALHLFSNFKWTGPAEPAVRLAAGLRDEGVEVVLRTSSYLKGGEINHVDLRAREDAGITPVLDLELGKHRSPLRDRRDAARLASILDDEAFDVIHTHLPNDFRIAVRARRGRELPIVRSFYDTDPERLDRRDVAALRRHASVVLPYSRRVGDALVAAGLDANRVVHVEPSIDLDRFDPARAVVDARPELGFAKGDFVAGIVARVQPYRRFDLLLDAAEGVARRLPNFRLLIIGRGSKIEEVAREPARRSGLLDRTVFFPGYRSGDDYVALLRALDVKLFLVPGTDGTARAVREALACALPVLTTARGMLDELVRDGETGRVLDETPEAFVDAILDLATDPEKRAAMAARAREDAERRFDPLQSVLAVRSVYERLAAPAGC